MTDPRLNDYFDALDRLIKNRPWVVERNSKITLKSVSIEAGRKPGTIRRAKKVYEPLISEITKAAIKKKENLDQNELKIQALKSELEKYKRLYEEALSREIVMSSLLLDELSEI